MAAPTSLSPRILHQYQHQSQNQNPNFFLNLHISISNNAYHHREQPSRDSQSPFYHNNAIFKFIISALLGFLQVQAVGNSFSSSEQHRIISVAFVISLLGYFLASRAKFRFPTYASQIDILMTVLANFSVASLVSLLLPNSKFWWPVIFIFHLVLISEPLYPATIKILLNKYVFPLFCRQPPPPLLPLTLTIASSATTAATPYRNVTAPATVVGDSLPVNSDFRRGQRRPVQIINAPATVSGSSHPFIYRRAQPLPRAEVSTPNEA